MKTICIVAGGPKNLLPDLNAYREENTLWAGVDRGVVYLAEKDLEIEQAIGDFDSISSQEREWLESTVKDLSIYPSEKDKTDTDLALDWAIDQKPDKILLFGATGGRLDHLYANIFLLMRQFQTGIPLTLIDIHNEMELFQPGSYTAEKKEQFPYLSFIPFSSDVAKLTLEGFKYPLHNRHIPFGSTLCVSNELILSKGTFSFESGILMMIRSRDDSPLL
ncbi:thiamine diphosphokinase [Metabacillus sp. RGM 3146]|uniref:thiamine diphosphokinase n=1 Tax=Metabacillus sp. RGM 3146 TaxID=3401092 RepID=UPI003B9BFBFA